MIAEAPRAVVLVVDDQECLRLRLSDELGRSGHTVLTASSASAAERFIEGLGLPMVVVLDLDMRPTSGLRLLQALLSRADADNLRFVLISALSLVDQVAPGRRSVFARLLTPIDLTALSATVRAAGAQFSGASNGWPWKEAR